MANKLTRNRIVDTADQLFYEQGFEHTSFAQIAETLGISRGNFYYHFKTKDEILDAVISHRLVRTNSMLDNWELEGDTPVDRIRSFINILVVNRAKIKRYGCPVGTLCTELAKLDHPVRNHANELFTLFRTWLRRQFEQLDRCDDADELAMHLLAFSQGVATLSSAFQDEKFIHSEVSRLDDWLSSFPTSTNNQSEVL
ncbi:TetR/AcrR family transcriptional regulator [Motilimonas sp. 1_MG-2023]|uniref:TetR/AcrR family transcriptional regulator n=1 Tax=Motilimonas sp. 1_MG-2023 TaxID=3062672 RepID=UPI0026E39702|nr:TetR/AcrR family transcriptional regulator [Motilimonas sp. 1_MG-2023]MDO6527492.1 TetR/AcrR family transcriptional regulator [Motilimonas sp. 1_MG-2023]